MKKILPALLSLLILSCASNPYRKTNRLHRKQAGLLLEQLDSYPPENGFNRPTLKYAENWAGTTNFGLRKPNYVVLHHTAQESVEHTLRTFTLPRTQVSAHYVISEDGIIHQMLNDHYRAWHAGVGKWGNNTDINSSSIGIELDNKGSEPFSEAQIVSLLELLDVLKERYDIPTANFLGHSDIAPARKVDPNATFPWKRLAESGFGYWYDENVLEPEIALDTEKIRSQRINAANAPFEQNEVQGNSGEKEAALPSEIDPLIALRIIGYDTSNPDAAIRAFKLHFVQQNINSELTEQDLKILFNLYQKYL